MMGLQDGLYTPLSLITVLKPNPTLGPVESPRETIDVATNAPAVGSAQPTLS